MEDRFRQVIERVYENEITKLNYISRMTGLLRKIDADSLFTVLEDPVRWYPKIREAYPSITTRRNLLTVFLALFTHDKELKEDVGGEDVQKKWRQYHDELVRYQKTQQSKSEPSKKQVEKYTSFEEIETKYRDLGKKSPHESLRSSQQYLLLSVVLHLKPKRADLGSVKIYHEKNPNRTDENYIVLRTRGSSYLVMNLYKTNKFYHTVEEDLPRELTDDLQTSLRRHPRDFLFVSSEEKPMSNNTYSKWVSHIFSDLFGKSTGVSLLRHTFISEKLDVSNMTLGEREDVARKMGHSTTLQDQYRFVKPKLCPQICKEYIEKHYTRKNHNSNNKTKKNRS
jgi:integrase